MSVASDQESLLHTQPDDMHSSGTFTSNGDRLDMDEGIHENVDNVNGSSPEEGHVGMTLITQEEQEDPSYSDTGSYDSNDSNQRGDDTDDSAYTDDSDNSYRSITSLGGNTYVEGEAEEEEDNDTPGPLCSLIDIHPLMEYICEEHAWSETSSAPPDSSSSSGRSVSARRLSRQNRPSPIGDIVVSMDLDYFGLFSSDASDIILSTLEFSLPEETDESTQHADAYSRAVPRGRVDITHYPGGIKTFSQGDTSVKWSIFPIDSSPVMTKSNVQVCTDIIEQGRPPTRGRRTFQPLHKLKNIQIARCYKDGLVFSMHLVILSPNKNTSYFDSEHIKVVVDALNHAIDSLKRSSFNPLIWETFQKCGPVVEGDRRDSKKRNGVKRWPVKNFHPLAMYNLMVQFKRELNQANRWNNIPERRKEALCAIRNQGCYMLLNAGSKISTRIVTKTRKPGQTMAEVIRELDEEACEEHSKYIQHLFPGRTGIHSPRTTLLVDRGTVIRCMNDQKHIILPSPTEQAKSIVDFMEWQQSRVRSQHSMHTGQNDDSHDGEVDNGITQSRGEGAGGTGIEARGEGGNAQESDDSRDGQYSSMEEGQDGQEEGHGSSDGGTGQTIGNDRAERQRDFPGEPQSRLRSVPNGSDLNATANSSGDAQDDHSQDRNQVPISIDAILEQNRGYRVSTYRKTIINCCGDVMGERMNAAIVREGRPESSLAFPSHGTRSHITVYIDNLREKAHGNTSFSPQNLMLNYCHLINVVTGGNYLCAYTDMDSAGELRASSAGLKEYSKRVLDNLSDSAYNLGVRMEHTEVLQIGNNTLHQPCSDMPIAEDRAFLICKTTSFLDVVESEARKHLRSLVEVYCNRGTDEICNLLKEASPEAKAAFILSHVEGMSFLLQNYNQRCLGPELDQYLEQNGWRGVPREWKRVIDREEADKLCLRLDGGIDPCLIARLNIDQAPGILGMSPSTFSILFPRNRQRESETKLLRLSSLWVGANAIKGKRSPRHHTQRMHLLQQAVNSMKHFAAHSLATSKFGSNNVGGLMKRNRMDSHSFGRGIAESLSLIAPVPIPPLARLDDTMSFQLLRNLFETGIAAYYQEMSYRHRLSQCIVTKNQFDRKQSESRELRKMLTLRKNTIRGSKEKYYIINTVGKNHPLFFFVCSTIEPD